MSPSDAGPRSAGHIVRAIARTPVTVYAAVVAPVAIAMVAVALQPWLPPSHLLRDSQVVAVAHGEPHAAYGLASNAGILVMALASGAALLGWCVLRGAPGPMRALLGCAGLLSLAIVLDDLLMLHETLTFAAGARLLVAAAYAGAFAWFLVRFRVPIRRRLDVGLLALAGVALGTSLLVDTVVEPATQLSVVAEDGAKLLGLAAWSVFVLRAAVLALRDRGVPGNIPARRGGHRLPETGAHPRARHGVRVQRLGRLRAPGSTMRR